MFNVTKKLILNLNHLSVPLWDLVSTIESLTLIFDDEVPLHWTGVENDGRAFASFELSVHDLQNEKERSKTHKCVMARTIYAAATGGRLKRLHIEARNPRSRLVAPFTTRALLPFWVGVEHWSGRFEGYIKVVACLRLYLSHASRWMGVKTSMARYDAKLTRQEVQGVIFDWVPKIPSAFTNRLRVYEALIWLHEDAELAQQVSNVWNALVRGGTSNVMGCLCERCKAYLVTYMGVESV